MSVHKQSAGLSRAIKTESVAACLSLRDRRIFGKVGDRKIGPMGLKKSKALDSEVRPFSVHTFLCPPQ